eukprot:CAMPEP_0119003308 /NCGR_PEP_ID=MMETSP1176-20130426/486_1 /TAXON_ID=265551 /ORGANISM="Synedropsis recta cf, Strain CCMP1620" /LENGTH=431 /DNA_ID=CAMNT_0006954897 /DNA_START=18 /DNA_END=1310 /DNA_ORIENTATION=+
MAEASAVEAAPDAAPVPPPAAAQTKGNKVAMQLNKLKEANNKYKSLLKLAKQRITTQEQEMETCKADNKRMKEQIDTTEQQQPKFSMANNEQSSDDNNTMEENSSNIVRVCQRIEQEGDGGGGGGGIVVTWALMDFEVDNPDTPDPPKRWQKWKRFQNASQLDDYIRRDTGEPLVVPPVSLSPDQSRRIQGDAKQTITKVTDDFRRFRVRSEVSRKQTDAHIRDLQTTNVATAKRRIEGEDLDIELEQARSDHAQLELLKNELAAQEAQWKEAYDFVMAENQSLKASGSEALLAAQWRQRYESCLTEKDDLQTRLGMEVEKADVVADQRRKVDAGKYEMKYRDLKESFRLYRKKAKEIFEAQQRGDVGLLDIAEKSSGDAKLSYIRNLMVNYLSSDVAVREHMEGAIGTVLKFSADDIVKIEKKKLENEAW